MLLTNGIASESNPGSGGPLRQSGPLSYLATLRPQEDLATLRPHLKVTLLVRV